MADVSVVSSEPPAQTLDELRAQVTVLTAIVGAMAGKSRIDFERFEECITQVAKQFRPGWRTVLFARASLILESFDDMREGIDARKKTRF